MKPIVIFAIAFVLLFPIGAYAEHDVACWTYYLEPVIVPGVKDENGKFVFEYWVYHQTGTETYTSGYFESEKTEWITPIETGYTLPLWYYYIIEERAVEDCALKYLWIMQDNSHTFGIEQ
jgi:hypothetical protein